MQWSLEGRFWDIARSCVHGNSWDISSCESIPFYPVRPQIVPLLSRISAQEWTSTRTHSAGCMEQGHFQREQEIPPPWCRDGLCLCQRPLPVLPGVGAGYSRVGTQDSIMIRVPDLTVLVHLIDMTGPLAINSANPSGEVDSTHHDMVIS